MQALAQRGLVLFLELAEIQDRKRFLLLLLEVRSQSFRESRLIGRALFRPDEVYLAIGAAGGALEYTAFELSLLCR